MIPDITERRSRQLKCFGLLFIGDKQFRDIRMHSSLK